MYSHLNVIQLKTELIRRQASTRGRKADLIERYVWCTGIFTTGGRGSVAVFCSMFVLQQGFTEAWNAGVDAWMPGYIAALLICKVVATHWHVNIDDWRKEYGFGLRLGYSTSNMLTAIPLLCIIMRRAYTKTIFWLGLGLRLRSSLGFSLGFDMCIFCYTTTLLLASHTHKSVASIHWCSGCSNTPIISAGGVHPYLNTPRFFLRIGLCAFYQQMVCTCKVYICWLDD